MEMALIFNNITLSPFPHENSLWIRGAELARALGFAREDKVTQIYQRHADEFTPDMTQLIENAVEPQNKVQGNLTPGRCRIFSLRGCHLLAMFARTPVAKAFRKWVLDVLDRIAAEERAALPHVPHIQITPSTPASRKPLRSLVNAWARLSGQHQETLWPQVKAHFQLERINDLPEEWLPDALDWVQGKIDGLPKALPAPNPVKAPLLSLTPEELAALDRAAQRVEELNRHVMKEISDLHGDILDCLDLRRMPFPAWRFLGAYIYSSLRSAAVLPSRCLEQENNPALAVKMLAGALDER